MNRRTVLVTGAGGFLGGHVVRELHRVNCFVKAGVHHLDDRRQLNGLPDVETVQIDILDSGSLRRAMKGVDHVYHCAALVDSRSPRDRLMQVNAAGTRLVFECAAFSGVRKAIYCSSTAVYGLLAWGNGDITEKVKPRVIEAYGYSKLQGEMAALDVSARTGLHLTVIRPVAIFGPGEHTPFGRKLRDAAFSRLVIAGGFRNKSFSFVHVEDVAAAAVHLMELDLPTGEVYNVSVDKPILFEDAFKSYVNALRKAGRSYTKVRIFASLSSLLHNYPSALGRLSAIVGDRYMFGIWHPGFDLTYSSEKLISTSFKFKWQLFEEVFASCLTGESISLSETGSFPIRYYSGSF